MLKTNNKESLKDAVVSVLQGKSLTAREIVDELIKGGYNFEQIDGKGEPVEEPIESVRIILYTEKELIINSKAIFSLKEEACSNSQITSGRTALDEKDINFEKIEDYFKGNFDTKEQNRFEFQANPKWKPIKFGIFEKLETEPNIIKALTKIKEYYSIHNRLPIIANSAVDAAKGLVWSHKANQETNELNQKFHEGKTFELEIGFYDDIDSAIKGLTELNSSLISSSEEILGLYYDVMDLNTGIRYLGGDGERRLVSSCWPIYRDDPEGYENLLLPESGQTINSLFIFSEKGYCPRDLFDTYSKNVLCS